MSDFQTRLKAKDFKLSLLLEITKAINSNYSTARLLEMFEDILKNKLSIGKAMLFGHYEEWKCLLHFGSGREHEMIQVKRDLFPIKDISTLNISNDELRSSFEIVVPVYHKEKPLAYLLLGDMEEQKIEFSTVIKHLPFVQTLTNIIIVAIENKKLYKETLRQATLTKELELASEMQQMLFPESLPDDNIVSAAAVYLPHHQVGGDYYDFFYVTPDDILLCMGDVSGKGVSAALLMSNFQANLRALAPLHQNVASLAYQLNKKVFQSAKGEKYITVFLAKYNITSKQLSFINAGHPAPFLINGENKIMLESIYPGLGMMEETEFVQAAQIHLTSNSLLFCCTDGVLEQENHEGVPFGHEKLAALLFENKSNRPKAVNKNIVLALESYKGSEMYSDDITLLTCRFL